jgi:hypothetical protein
MVSSSTRSWQAREAARDALSHRAIAIFFFSSLCFTTEDHRTPEQFAATVALFSNCSRSRVRHILADLLSHLAAFRIILS